MLVNFKRELRLVEEVMAESEILGYWEIWPRIWILTIFQSAALSDRIILIYAQGNDLINTQFVCEVRARKGEASRDSRVGLHREILDPRFLTPVGG